MSKKYCIYCIKMICSDIHELLYLSWSYLQVHQFLYMFALYVFSIHLYRKHILINGRYLKINLNKHQAMIRKVSFMQGWKSLTHWSPDIKLGLRSSTFSNLLFNIRESFTSTLISDILVDILKTSDDTKMYLTSVALRVLLWLDLRLVNSCPRSEENDSLASLRSNAVSSS